MEYLTYQRQQAEGTIDRSGHAFVTYPRVENPAIDIQFDKGIKAMYLGVMDFEISDPVDTYFVYDPSKIDVARIEVDRNDQQDIFEKEMELLRCQMSPLETTGDYIVAYRQKNLYQFRKAG